MVIYLGVMGKGMYAKYEVSISCGSKKKNKAKVTVDNRKDRTKTICPDHSIRWHKSTKPNEMEIPVSKFRTLTIIDPITVHAPHV